MSQGFNIRVDIDLKELEDLEKLKLRRAQDNAMDKSLNLLLREAQKYPPELPNQKYVRTYNHYRSILREKFSFRAGRILFTDRVTIGEYAHWLRSYILQATIHRNRWPTDEQLARRLTPAIKRIFSREIEKIK